MPSLTASGGHFVEGRNRHRCNSLSIPGGEARARLCGPGLTVLWRGLRLKEQDQPCRGCTLLRHRRVNSLLIGTRFITLRHCCRAISQEDRSEVWRVGPLTSPKRANVADGLA